MQQIPYSRLLNRPVRYFKFFTFMDIFLLVIGLVVLTPILGLNFFVTGFLLYMGHILLFRIGKRPGYDVHFFKSLVRPESFRAGGGKKFRAILYNYDRNVR